MRRIRGKWIALAMSALLVLQPLQVCAEMTTEDCTVGSGTAEEAENLPAGGTYRFTGQIDLSGAEETPEPGSEDASEPETEDTGTASRTELLQHLMLQVLLSEDDSSLLTNIDWLMDGMSLIRIIAQLDEGMQLLYAAPELDEQVYLYDLGRAQSGPGNFSSIPEMIPEYPQIEDEQYTEIAQRYAKILAGLYHEERLEVSGPEEVRLLYLGETVTASVYTYEPTAEDVEAVMEQLAAELLTDTQLDETVYAWTDWIRQLQPLEDAGIITDVTVTGVDELVASAGGTAAAGTAYTADGYTTGTTDAAQESASGELQTEAAEQDLIEAADTLEELYEYLPQILLTYAGDAGEFVAALQPAVTCVMDEEILYSVDVSFAVDEIGASFGFEFVPDEESQNQLMLYLDEADTSVINVYVTGGAGDEGISGRVGLYYLGGQIAALVYRAGPSQEGLTGAPDLEVLAAFGDTTCTITHEGEGEADVLIVDVDGVSEYTSDGTDRITFTGRLERTDEALQELPDSEPVDTTDYDEEQLQAILEGWGEALEERIGSMMN